MQALAVATVAWAVAAIALLVQGGRLEPAKVWGAAVITVFALPLVPIALSRTPAGWWLIDAPYLWGPAVLAYTVVLLGRPPRPVWLLHAVPAIVWFLIAVFSQDVRESLAGAADSVVSIPPPGLPAGPAPAASAPVVAPPAGPPPPDLARRLYGLGNAVSVLVYGIVAALTIGRARRRVREFHSALTPSTTLSWLRLIILLYMVTFAVAIVLLLFLGVTRTQAFQLPAIVQHIPIAAFVLVFTVFGTGQGVVLPATSEAKYSRSGLSETESRDLVGRLRSHMDERKPHLHEDLTLADLATEMGVSRHHLSQVINESVGSNFYQLVNEYRLKEFERRIRNGADLVLSLTGLALECGFRSISAFYSAMKQLRQEKPSELAARIHAESAD